MRCAGPMTYGERFQAPPEQAQTPRLGKDVQKQASTRGLVVRTVLPAQPQAVSFR